MRFSLLKTKVALGVTFSLTLSSFLLTSTITQAQSFHKWVDQNGSTHYTLTPPPANAKKVSQVATYSDRTTYTAPTTEEAKPNNQNTENTNQTPTNERTTTSEPQSTEAR